MEFFPALGLAVLGIFVTIILSGMLAGIITFGLLDAGLRRVVQERVIRSLVDRRVADFFARDSAEQSFAEDGWWERAGLHYLKDWNEDRYAKNWYLVETLVTSLVRLDPNSLFRLPYRQLCGQIANVISAESDGADKDHDRPSDFQPLTLALVIADMMGAGKRLPRSGPFSSAFARTRALAFLDAIQIALADAVLVWVGLLSIILVTIIFLAILVPNFDALNIYGADSSVIARGLGRVLSMVIAPVLIAGLAVAATIVSMLTFRWIDQYASAR